MVHVWAWKGLPHRGFRAHATSWLWGPCMPYTSEWYLDSLRLIAPGCSRPENGWNTERTRTMHLRAGMAQANVFSQEVQDGRCVGPGRLYSAIHALMMSTLLQAPCVDAAGSGWIIASKIRPGSKPGSTTGSSSIGFVVRVCCVRVCQAMLLQVVL